jgi:hypothetical protein
MLVLPDRQYTCGFGVRGGIRTLGLPIRQSIGCHGKQDPERQGSCPAEGAARPSAGVQCPARASLPSGDLTSIGMRASERAGVRLDRPDEGAARASPRPRLGVAGGAGHGPCWWRLRAPQQGPPERLPAGRVRGPEDHGAVGGDGAVRVRSRARRRSTAGWTGSSRWAWSSLGSGSYRQQPTRL